MALIDIFRTLHPKIWQWNSRRLWTVSSSQPHPPDSLTESVIHVSMRSISSTISFKACVSLLIFCFEDLSIGVTRVLKSPTIIVLLSISPFMSVSICLMYWGTPVLRAKIFTIVFLLDWSLDHYVVSFLISCNLLYFKVYFVWYEDCYSSIVLLPICIEYIFPSSHFQSTYVLRSEVGFL